MQWNFPSFSYNNPGQCWAADVSVPWIQAETYGDSSTLLTPRFKHYCVNRKQTNARNKREDTGQYLLFIDLKPEVMMSLLLISYW